MKDYDTSLFLSLSFSVLREMRKVKIETIEKYDTDTRHCRSQIRFQYRSRVRTH